jgi:hypothetical protein
VNDWPLVGRRREFALVTGLIRSPEHHGAVLAGPSGVGKTRLAAECLADAEQAGLRTVRVTATRSVSQLPFGALAPLLPPADPGGADDRAGFLRRCCEAIAARGEGTRPLFLVDDAHWLDDASATLTHQLAATGSAFVLATLRTGEPPPDAVSALWKDAIAERLDLGTLADDALEEVLVSALGGPVEKATVARLGDHSGGNILFLRELVLAAAGSGLLAQDAGLWRLVGPLKVSDRLVELVETRLDGLGEAERGLLELLAVGEPLGAVELTTLADATMAEKLERQALVRRRCLAPEW